ncbi:lipoprotein [Mycoplasmoides genitalium M6320]|uniref:Lipoprotein n=1 Tax=Mycoplasmoides genitalium M6320 TaxID=662945 RepID=A0ABC7ZJ44_MYCGT|nr:BMP family protein [Mycoplasmoides genitalium]AFQ03831.1 lipoprotein [Mycoplasmoides genitalium M6320]
MGKLLFGKLVFKKSLFLLSGMSSLAVFWTACGATKIFDSSVQLLVSDNFSTLADKSFSQMSYEGIRSFFKKSKGVDLPEADSSQLQEGNGLWKRPGFTLSDRIATFNNIKNDGSDVIVATGFNQQESLQAITSDDIRFQSDKESLAKTGFIFVDGAIEKEFNKRNAVPQFKSTPTNISSVAFRSDDGSFLTGVATAVYLNLNQEYFLDKSGWSTNSSNNNELTVSGFVGITLPSTLSFLNGFRLGIAYFNEVIYKHLSDAQDSSAQVTTSKQTVLKQLQVANGEKKIKKIKWISSKQGSDGETINIQDHQSGSFSDTEPRAITIANNLIDKGVNAIIPIAGPQTNLVVTQIARRQAHTAVIGVDSAQELLDINIDAPNKDKLKMGNKKIIPFSSIKALDVAVESILSTLEKGSSQNGYQGFGYNNIGTVKNNSVGVSEAGYEFLIDPVFWKNTSSMQAMSLSASLKANAASSSDNKKKLSEVATKKNENGSTKNGSNGIIDKYAKLLTKSSSSTSMRNGSSDSNQQNFKTTDNDGDWTIVGDELGKYKSSELPIFTGISSYPTFQTEAQNVLDGGANVASTQGFKWSFKQI